MPPGKLILTSIDATVDSVFFKKTNEQKTLAVQKNHFFGRLC